MEYPNPFDGPLTGLEIKDWTWHHSHNKTKYTALAKRMNACFNLNNEKKYVTTLRDGKPIITEVSEKEQVYEVSCDSSNGN